MTKRGEMLRTFFIGIGLALCQYADAQLSPKSIARIKPGTRLENNIPIAPDSVRTSEAARIAGPKTGVLLIKGPEDMRRATKAEITASYQDLDNFEQAFARYPHAVIGGPKDSVSLNCIHESLLSLGAQSQELFLIIDMHGLSTYATAMDSTAIVYKTTNGLQARMDKDGNACTFTSAQLFGAIGQWMRDEPVLKNKRLTISHTACSGASAAIDVTELPPGTQIVVNTDDDENAWDNDANVYDAFARNPYARFFSCDEGWSLTQKHIVPQLVVAGNLFGREKKYKHVKNRMKVFTITERHADSLVTPLKSLPVGRYGGRVVDCSAVMKDFCKNYSRAEIDSAVASNKNDLFLNPNDVDGILKTLNILNRPKKIDLSKEKNAQRLSQLDYLMYIVASAYPDRLPSIAEYADDHDFMRVYPQRALAFMTKPQP